MASYDYKEKMSEPIHVNGAWDSVDVNVGETWYAILPGSKKRRVVMVKIISFSRTMVLLEQESDLSRFSMDYPATQTRYATNDIQFMERLPAIVSA